MRSIDKITILCSLLIAAGFFTGAGMQLGYINQQQQDMGLVIEKPQDLPPTLAFATIATGAFRGLVVDILWLRADKLKEERQFYDAKQLAEWITILQPRFPAVWEFHAWNMAYNISVTIPASQPDQRWKWVKNGYELIRDEAIDKYKLKDIDLYRELARIFQHKIGDIADDANKYYKIELAIAIGPLVENTSNVFFDAMANAPKKFETIENDPNYAVFIDSLREADKQFDDSGSKFIENYLLLIQTPLQTTDGFSTAAKEVLLEYAGTETLRKFDAFAKAYQLRNKWKMDPDFMRELNQTYGPIDLDDPNNTRLPLDWLHPDSHAIYWAAKGLQVNAEGDPNEFDVADTHTDRLLGISLHNLFRKGKMRIFDVNRPIASSDPSQEPRMEQFKDIFLRPDLRMFGPYNEYYMAVIEEYKKQDLPLETIESFETGHRNMLKNAMLMFYQAGHRAEAQKIYDRLRELYPRDEFTVSLVTYARNYLLEKLESFGLKDATEQILAMLIESFYLYAIYEDNDSYNTERFVSEVYNYYQADQVVYEKLQLPKFSELKTLALLDFFDDPLYPDYVKYNLLERLGREKPDLYEQLRAYVQSLSEQSEQ